MRSMFSGVSGLKNHQTAMDVIGNNVANVNTTAFKASRVIFQDVVSQTVSEAVAPTTSTGGRNSMQIGLGVTIGSVSKDMTEGSAQTTDSPLDFTIKGEGYFVVQNVDGTLSYTRSGSLTLDKAGNLVTVDGQYVMAVNGTGSAIADGTTITKANLGKIQLLGTLTTDANSYYSDYAVDGNGIVTATKVTTSGGSTTTASVSVGRLVLATFNNPGSLDAQGDSCYEISNNSGDAAFHFVNDNAGNLQSGQLEMSNVSLATELTNMIIVQRGFQANSRVITTSDSMLEELVNLKR